MKCDHCEATACVHFVAKELGEWTEKHLCEQCSREREGVDFPDRTDEEGHSVVARFTSWSTHRHGRWDS